MPKKPAKTQKPKPLSRSGMLVDAKLTELPPAAMSPKSSTQPTVIHHDGKAGFRARNTWARVDTLLREGKRGDRCSGQNGWEIGVWKTDVSACRGNAHQSLLQSPERRRL
jgi:hypothetical protein